MTIWKWASLKKWVNKTASTTLQISPVVAQNAPKCILNNNPPISKFAQGRPPGPPQWKRTTSHTYPTHMAMCLSLVSYSLNVYYNIFSFYIFQFLWRTLSVSAKLVSIISPKGRTLSFPLEAIIFFVWHFFLRQSEKVFMTLNWLYIDLSVLRRKDLVFWSKMFHEPLACFSVISLQQWWMKQLVLLVTSTNLEQGVRGSWTGRGGENLVSYIHWNFPHYCLI